MGLVTGESLIGANLYKDMLGEVKGVVKKHQTQYEEQLAEARRIAIKSMAEKAEKLGANAIIGTRVEYNNLGGSMGNTIMVTVTGTAVVLGGRETIIQKSTEKVRSISYLPEKTHAKPESSKLQAETVSETSTKNVEPTTTKGNSYPNEQYSGSDISFKEIREELNELENSKEDHLKLDYFSYDIEGRLKSIDAEKQDFKLGEVLVLMDKKNKLYEKKLNKYQF